MRSVSHVILRRDFHVIREHRESEQLVLFYSGLGGALHQSVTWKTAGGRQGQHVSEPIQLEAILLKRRGFNPLVFSMLRH